MSQSIGMPLMARILGWVSWASLAGAVLAALTALICRWAVNAEARRQGFGSLYLYTHEQISENRALYSKIGYIEYDRRVEYGFARVYMRKSLE